MNPVKILLNVPMQSEIEKNRNTKESGNTKKYEAVIHLWKSSCVKPFYQKTNIQSSPLFATGQKSTA